MAVPLMAVLGLAVLGLAGLVLAGLVLVDNPAYAKYQPDPTKFVQIRLGIVTDNIRWPELPNYDEIVDEFPFHRNSTR
jgi:hypothetical protein